MSDPECKFQDGMIIYKEGERNRTAFVVLSGQVELLKKTANGLVRIGITSPGEIFGEMGIVDKSARSVTARAVGDVVVQSIVQPEVTSSSTNETKSALKAVRKITKSLHNSNQMLVSPTSQKILIDAQSKSNIWSLIGGIIAKRRHRKRLLEVRIAPLVGDGDGAIAVHLANTLGQKSEVRATVLLEEQFENKTVDGDNTFNSAILVRRQLLRRDKADLMIWGEVDQAAMALELRFLSSKIDADQPGCFLATDRLSLPIGFSPEYGNLLFAVVIAATVPRSESYRLMMRPLLINALEAAQDAGTEPPVELTKADQASIQVCYGNVVSSIGSHLNNCSYFQQAVLSYQSAAKTISPEVAPVEWANVHYHLGRIRHIMGDKSRDREVLETALESYKTALLFFTKAEYPWEWAMLQNRLGGLLYSFDTLNNNTESLKDAVTAFQSSLRVINREVAPLRWGEVKNSLGQALQVWGDTAQNRELLEAAIQCCEDALHVRTREETPLLWAATQNNLGSALFLLSRHIKAPQPLEKAGDAFGKALSIYQAYGATRLSKVAERNQTKANELLKSMRTRRVPKVEWEDEYPPIGNEDPERQSEHASDLAGVLE